MTWGTRKEDRRCRLAGRLRRRELEKKHEKQKIKVIIKK